jgi:hypothetical protein
MMLSGKTAAPGYNALQHKLHIAGLCRRFAFPAAFFHFYHCHPAKTIMGHDIKNLKEAIALVQRAWREASGFFLSIELWLMVLAAAGTVGGAWLAVLGDAWSLPVLVFAFGYIPARMVLHLKRILAWPFI